MGRVLLCRDGARCRKGNRRNRWRCRRLRLQRHIEENIATPAGVLVGAKKIIPLKDLEMISNISGGAACGPCTSPSQIRGQEEWSSAAGVVVRTNNHSPVPAQIIE